MGKLFNRPVGGTIDAALTSALSSDEVSHAIARNFQIDPRLSAERGGDWEIRYSFATDVEFLRQADNYYKTQIRDASMPAFLQADNKNNIVYGGTSHPLIPPNLELVCCLDLTGLHFVMKLLRDVYRLPYFETYPTSVRELDAKVDSWHRERIEGKTEQETKNHLAAILDGLREHTKRGNPYHPVWATLLKKFEIHARKDAPAGWPALVGVKRCFESNRWLAMLRYRVDRSQTLYRPTVLDAGTYPYHYPTPPTAPLVRGGHPMNLESRRIYPPLPEYIHQQIGFVATDWWAGWVGSTSGLTDRALSELREHHTNILADRYGDEVRKWAVCS